MTVDFSDLEQWPPAETKPKAKEKFPCHECHGTGKWPHGTNRSGESKCFVCKGTGYFMSSHFDRLKKREQRRSKKAASLVTAQAAFEEANPGLIAKLRTYVGWNEFAKSLVEQFDGRGDLSDKQIAAAQGMIAKTEAKRAERDSDLAVVDLSVIRGFFDTAVSNGLKRPKYRAEDLILSRAPDHGKNAGSLYVKTTGDEYQGKITPDNVFRPIGSAKPETVVGLNTIAADPEEASVRYGRRTGSCGCCGRELTNAESVERGIGPICASNFGW